MPDINPGGWLDYGALGLAGMLCFMALTLAWWSVKKCLTTSEKMNDTLIALLSVGKETQDASTCSQETERPVG